MFTGIKKVIWIIGSSLVVKASEHSRIRPLGSDLGLEQLGYRLMWVGMSGMKVFDVVPLVHTMINLFGLPSIIFIHVGGNDVGAVSCGNLLFDLKFMLYVVSNMLPSTQVVFSSILPRLSCRFSGNLRAIDVMRKRINRGVKSYLKKSGGFSVVYTDFEDKYPSLFNEDGVHLSFIGNDIFLHSIQSALEQFIHTPHQFVYPIEQ